MYIYSIINGNIYTYIYYICTMYIAFTCSLCSLKQIKYLIYSYEYKNILDTYIL